MPKILFVKLQVPSGSRPERMKLWLNNLLEEHGMEVQTVEEVDPPKELMAVPKKPQDFKGYRRVGKSRNNWS
jgi:hypothetical protein